jgi:hypothetical protein
MAATAVLVSCSGAGTAHVTATPCGAGKNVVLASSDLGAFTQFVHYESSVYPYRGLPFASPPSYVSRFRAGVTIGFINNVALGGEFRADEDRIAWSNGYTPGKWPLVPLEGSVVQATPGLLEVYEYTYVFAAPADAASWVQYALNLNAGDASKTSAGTMEGLAAYIRVLGPSDGRHETAVMLVGRVGTVGVTLEFQGGVEVTPAGVSGLVRTALKRIRTTCQENTVQGMN